MGTLVRDDATGVRLADLIEDGQEYVVAKGGRGGKGNACYATSTNRAPTFAEKGEPGVNRWVKLELKLLADVGRVGYPSVGKSSIIAQVSAARPEIAAYHFTTLTPVLGVVRIDADSVVNRGYIGNGVQWDPYALDYGQGRIEISDADWAKLYARLDFMRPAFIRVMTNTTSVVRDGRLDRMRGFEHLSHILDYCQSHGVTVMFGDWGGSLMDARAGTVNRTLLDHAAAYVAWLVGEKGYDCIRYYNLDNAPNGFWSTADADFDLWAKAVSYFRGRLDAEGLAGKWSWSVPTPRSGDPKRRGG